MLSEQDILLICQVGMGLFGFLHIYLLFTKDGKIKPMACLWSLFVPIFHGNLSLPFLPTK